MPELPEVETVVRGLRETIAGSTIIQVRLYAPPTSIVVSPSLNGTSFERILTGRTVNAVSRRGKNIIISLSNDVTLWVHLKMTGRFLELPPDTPRNKHDLILFDFIRPESRGHVHLRFNDYRRFGRLRIYPDHELWAQDGLSELGPEPLEITAEEFLELCLRRSRMIKPALLDQSFIAGIGNIYADESLYFAKIHPRRLTTSVSRAKLIELHRQLQRMLKKSIRLMGTSVNTYSGVNGKPGTFQHYLKAYGREGEPCQFCGRPLVREKIGSRSAVYCRNCQRLPRSNKLRPVSRLK
jgi:formamidopyrimidine-DNA glycosylase